MNCEKKPISIYQGFGTKWDNNDLLTVTFDSEIDINGFGAEFIIGGIVKSYSDIQGGFSVNLTASETATLAAGPICGTLVLIDLESNKRPFSTELPFVVKDWAGGDIELDGFNITINSKVESSDLVINISTKNPLAINEETIRTYIALHNQSQEAHPYIRELISNEVLARKGADSELSDRISANTSKFDNYRTSADQDVIDATFETKNHANTTFATKTELSTGLNTKQDKLTAGAAINITSNNFVENMGVRDISTGTTNGTISMNKAGSRSEVAIAGLKSAAYTPASDYATAAQGALADTALQSGDNISELVNDSDYATNTEVETDISNHNTSELAHSYIRGLISSEVTRAEGVEGSLSSLNTDSKTNLVSAINEVDGHTDTNTSNIGTLSSLITDAKNNLVVAINEVDSHADTNASDISTIESKIPEQATSSNQLADKDFVNSSIATNTANFIGTFNSVEELEAYTGPLTNNDYAFVIVTDSAGNTAYDRYKYTDATTPASWVFEYELNNSSFTANQWAAINSGATTTNIEQITTNQNNIGTLSSLTTTTKDNLVAAINELDSNKIDGNTAITGATKCKITYDGKGLVTGGADLQASDIPSLTLSKISDVTASASEVNVLDGITASTTELNVLDGITASTTELNYVDGVTSSIQTQLNGKVPDTRKVNNKTLSSDITLTASDVGALPDSTTIGNATLTIQKNGTDVTTFTANSTTNATANITVPTQASDIGALPDSTKYGAGLSYSSNSLQLKDQDGNALGNSVTIQSSPDIDEKSITKNTSDELQTVGVIDQNNPSTAIKTWTGTKVQFDAIEKENWYGWDVSGTTYYTKSATPQVGDTVYDSNREAIAYTVSAVSDGYIEWEEPDPITYRTITCTQGYIWSTDYHLSINNIEFPQQQSTSFIWDNIPVGSTVTLNYSSDSQYETDDLWISGSSNTDYIPNGYNRPPYTLTFIMPDEDLTFAFTLYD